MYCSKDRLNEHAKDDPTMLHLLQRGHRDEIRGTFAISSIGPAAPSPVTRTNQRQSYEIYCSWSITLVRCAVLCVAHDASFESQMPHSSLLMHRQSHKFSAFSSQRSPKSRIGIVIYYVLNGDKSRSSMLFRAENHQQPELPLCTVPIQCFRWHEIKYLFYTCQIFTWG